MSEPKEELGVPEDEAGWEVFAEVMSDTAEALSSCILKAEDLVRRLEGRKDGLP